MHEQRGLIAMFLYECGFQDFGFWAFFTSFPVCVNAALDWILLEKKRSCSYNIPTLIYMLATSSCSNLEIKLFKSFKITHYHNRHWNEIVKYFIKTQFCNTLTLESLLYLLYTELLSSSYGAMYLICSRGIYYGFQL